MPTSADVAAFLGFAGDADVVALADSHLPVVSLFVNAYTRGVGFDPISGDPTPELDAVILTATARMVSNPENLAREEISGRYTRVPAVAGWTLPELAVLHRYRRRTA